MENLIPKALEIIEIVAIFLAITTLLAQAIGRYLIKGVKDDELIAKYSGWVWKVIEYLPTIGVNPGTKKIREAYEDKLKNPKS